MYNQEKKFQGTKEGKLKKLWDEDAIQIALLMSRAATNCGMISVKKAKNFCRILNKKIEELQIEINKSPNDYLDDKIYYYAIDEMGEEYFVICPFDYKKTVEYYTPIIDDIYMLLLNDDVLKTINLIMVNGQIVSRSKYYASLEKKYRLRHELTMPEFDIFESWEQIPEDGFQEKHCLSDEEQLILRELRRNKSMQQYNISKSLVLKPKNNS